jgi:hypothetical protein
MKALFEPLFFATVKEEKKARKCENSMRFGKRANRNAIYVRVKAI